jgi:phosphatidylglycerophosphatase A
LVRDKGVIVFVSFLGIGKIPFAPGSVASLATLPIAFLLSFLPRFWHFVLLLLLFFLGVFLAGRAEIILQKRDHPIIVIDEVVGSLLALFYARTLLEFILGFFLFRLFDILKPFPLRKLETLKGGLGVMMDDVASGLLSCGFLLLLRQLGLP